MKIHAMSHEPFEVEHSDEEWKKRLSPAAYAVLRHHGTERAFTSPLNREKRTGTFLCAGCGQALFASGDKYESGSGWPSFIRPLPNAVETETDEGHGMVRTEVHCARCGGHLGHVFDDGPRPTGERFCMNGVALDFRPEQ
jgi:peptide-methionine (R)-S-oxide reductase